MTLMKKMDTINHRKPGGPGLDHVNQYHGKHHRLVDVLLWHHMIHMYSLNLEQRERELKRVVKENEVTIIRLVLKHVITHTTQATLKRIQQVQPHYRSTDWVSTINSFTNVNMLTGRLMSGGKNKN